MTRVLIVDDDESQLKQLARAFLARRNLDVVTASSGEAARLLLDNESIDIVLTDLQMPDINGLQLAQWLVQQHPQVMLFAMTAYPDDDSVEQLRELGGIHCFTKPLDVAAVHDRFAETLATGLQGHLSNVSLPSVLQLIEMDGKTCTLHIESQGQIGALYVDTGRLIDARTETQRGTEAAIEITSWPTPTLVIVNQCRTNAITVDRPVSFILMESMRRLDEDSRDQPAAPAPAEAGPGFDPFADLPPTPPPVPPAAAEPAPDQAILVLDLEGQTVRRVVGGFPHLEEIATLVRTIYQAQTAALALAGADDDVEELVITAGRFWALCRPLPSRHARVVVLLFDPEARANIVLQRMELDRFVDEGA